VVSPCSSLFAFPFAMRRAFQCNYREVRRNYRNRTWAPRDERRAFPHAGVDKWNCPATSGAGANRCHCLETLAPTDKRRDNLQNIEENKCRQKSHLEVFRTGFHTTASYSRGNWKGRSGLAAYRCLHFPTPPGKAKIESYVVFCSTIVVPMWSTV